MKEKCINKIAIFSQSAIDVEYVVALCETYKNYEKHIYVINVLNNYNFLISLNLSDTKIHFIPLYKINSVFRIVIASIRLYFLNRKYLLKNQYEEIFFFSILHDYVTFYFVSRLSKISIVNFIDINNFVLGESVENLKSKISKFLFYSLFNVKIYMHVVVGNLYYIYDYLNDNVQKLSFTFDGNLIEKYKALPCLEVDTINILIFESNGSQEPYFVDYESSFKELFYILTAGNSNIFIKPHPRSGNSSFIEELDSNVVFENIPVQFVDTSAYDLVLGIETTSICKIALNNSEDKRVYSVIDFFEFKDKGVKLEFVRELNFLSENTLGYLKDLEELKLLLIDKSFK